MDPSRKTNLNGRRTLVNIRPVPLMAVRKKLEIEEVNEGSLKKNEPKRPSYLRQKWFQIGSSNKLGSAGSSVVVFIAVVPGPDSYRHMLRLAGATSRRYMSLRCKLAYILANENACAGRRPEDRRIPPVLGSVVVFIVVVPQHACPFAVLILFFSFEGVRLGREGGPSSSFQA